MKAKTKTKAKAEKLSVAYIMSGAGGYGVATSRGLVSIHAWDDDYHAFTELLDTPPADGMDGVLRETAELLSKRVDLLQAAEAKVVKKVKGIAGKLRKAVGAEQAERMVQLLASSRKGVETDGDKLLLYKYVAGDMRSCQGNPSCKILSGDVDTYGRILNEIGVELRMERSDVDADPGTACSTGLHVGTYEFVTSNSSTRNVVLQVTVDPCDVVCCPSSGEGKFRVAAYTPVAVVCDARGKTPNTANMCASVLSELLGDKMNALLAPSNRELFLCDRPAAEKLLKATAKAAGLKGDARKKATSYHYMRPLILGAPEIVCVQGSDTEWHMS